MSADISGDNIICCEYVHNGDAFNELPPYIIMEYAENGTLKNVLDERKKIGKLFSIDELINIYKQLISGMEIINSKLVHRDIKFENILLCGNRLKITDFGLAKISAENTRTMTFKGGGTPLYMAWDYSKNTIQMDIYSMGIIFYELATLEYPYKPNPQTQEESKSRHLFTCATDPLKYNPNLNSILVSIIYRMLEKNTTKRFKEWTEISDYIKKINSSQQDSSNNSDLVDAFISIKNSRDIEKQRQESIRVQKENERNEFTQLTRSQIVNEIILPLQKFVTEVNAKYAGNNKLSSDLLVKHGTKNVDYFGY